MTRQAPDVYVIQKQTAIERYSRQDAGDDFLDYLRRDGQNLTSLTTAHDEHCRAREALFQVLVSQGISFEALNLDQLSEADFGFFSPNSPSSGLQPRRQLVLSLGGDGTLLHASHFCGGHVRLLGINSSPARSVGHLCAITSDTVAQTLPRHLQGERTPVAVPRLLVRSSKGHPLPLALNDLLLSHRHPAATSRYQITLDQNGRTVAEKHQSSGVWVSTPAGSTAAIRTHGLPRLDLDARSFLFAVREIYIPPEANLTLVGGILNGDTDSVTFFCRMRQGLVCIDGPDSFAPLGFGESLTVTLPREAALQLLVS